MNVTAKKELGDSPSNDPEPTQAGSYFVANYPPFSFWNRAENAKVESLLETTGKVENPMGLYIHIPFCRKRCHFCYFRVYTDKNSSEIASYLNAAVEELRLYTEKPFLAERRPKFVYFGGGTPSYLSARQLAAFSDRIKEHLPWDEAEEVAFECEPGTLNDSKLAAIRDIGVTRLSLGIENFDDEILDLNGRAHRSKEVFRSYEQAMSKGFPQINIDLIAGMIGETESKWQLTVERTLELEPDSVTVYQMEIPFNTTINKTMRKEGKIVAPVADWAQKRRWVDFAFQRMEEKGYTVTSGYTAVRDPDRAKFIYRDSLWRGADMLAIGVASFGHFSGHHYQNLKHFGDYIGRIDKGSLPIDRSLETSREEQLIRELILQMKLGLVSRPYFREKFDVDVIERFREQFSDLEKREMVRIDEDRISLNRKTLLRVDSLLPGFFLPQHRES